MNMSRFKAGAEIKPGQGGTPFLWGSPVILFNTANHDGVLSTPMVNEGTTGSVWDLVVQTGSSKYWAIKNYNWFGSPNVGSSWPTDWNSFIGGAPSIGPIVNIHITGPGYNGSYFIESELISRNATSSGLTYYHSFFPSASNSWYEVDTYAQPNWPFSAYVNYTDGKIEEAGGSQDYGLLMFGVASDVSTRSFKSWVYDKTYGYFSYSHTFASNGIAYYPTSPSYSDYVAYTDYLSTYTPASIEASQTIVERVFGYIGDNTSLPGVGTPWDACYLAGIWRPTKIPTDAEIMALYNYYIGQL